MYVYTSEYNIVQYMMWLLCFSRSGSLGGSQFGSSVVCRLIVKSWVSVGLRIACVTGMTWTLAVACHLYVQPVSRRFANLSFYLWIVSYFLLVVGEVVGGFYYHMSIT